VTLSVGRPFLSRCGPLGADSQIGTVQREEFERSNSRKSWLKDVEQELAQDGGERELIASPAPGVHRS
jgi:hypothetical protein